MATALRWGVGGQHHAPAALTQGKTRYPLYRRLGRPPGPVWMDAENLAPTGIRSPDSPASSESLYRLRYPGPIEHRVRNLKMFPIDVLHLYDSRIKQKLFTFILSINVLCQENFGSCVWLKV